MKNALIGGFVSLFVTVFGGIAVFYFTREPPQPPPMERLVFEVEPAKTFALASSTRSFVTIRAGNVGTKVANDVRLLAELVSAAILDKSVTLSTTPPAAWIDKSSSNSLDLRFETLAPREVATVTIMVEGSGLLSRIGMRSKDSNGEEGALIGVNTVTPASKKSSIPVEPLSIVIVIQGVVIGVAAVAGRARLRGVIPTQQSRPNTGFVLLHMGRAAEAERVLHREIEEKGAEPHLFSNYGLALILNGKEYGAAYLDAAEWWASSRQSKCILAFNRAVAALNEANDAKATAYLRDAFALNRRHIAKYCELSAYVQAAAQRNPELFKEFHLRPLQKTDLSAV